VGEKQPGETKGRHLGGMEKINLLSAGDTEGGGKWKISTKERGESDRPIRKGTTVIEGLRGDRIVKEDT